MIGSGSGFRVAVGSIPGAHDTPLEFERLALAAGHEVVMHAASALGGAVPVDLVFVVDP